MARAGWTITNDRKANAYAFPQERRVLVAFLPEGNDHAPNEKLWVIRTYEDLHQIVWEATFSSAAPAELIAAFLTDPANPKSLDPDREDDAPATTTLPVSGNASPTSDER
ncbi:DUF317 domain-containing protein [Actinomadura sp. 9N215]|uniref:DUF317 domain-containing protein n=1 Tax=Actinomadura sp. 9N215 TaxID=3375150 RepID=UPI0037B9EEBB